MDGHSKREVLEIFNMDKKNISLDFFSWTSQFVKYLLFLANGHLTYHVTSFYLFIFNIFSNFILFIFEFLFYFIPLLESITISMIYRMYLSEI